MGCNSRKASQLGMPLGTATGRLRKIILFNLLQRLGEDVCFRCGTGIETEEALSIEHKVPWLDSDASLFWNLNNIAFAHLSCNRPNRPFDLGLANRSKTCCPQGHKYTPENTVLQGARKARVCRVCKNRNERRRKRVSSNGRASAFQADDGRSSRLTRSSLPL